MGFLEKHLEQLLVNFPNLVSSYLWGRKFPVVKQFGDINVCVRQGDLPECNGRVDLVFVTETTLHAVELKRAIVSVKSLSQLERYLDPLQKRYPNHLVIGYLAGKRCPDWPSLKLALNNQRVRVLRMGHEIPRVKELRTCMECGAGYHYSRPYCPYCDGMH